MNKWIIIIPCTFMGRGKISEFQNFSDQVYYLQLEFRFNFQVSWACRLLGLEGNLKLNIVQLVYHRTATKWVKYMSVRNCHRKHGCETAVRKDWFLKHFLLSPLAHHLKDGLYGICRKLHYIKVIFYVSWRGAKMAYCWFERSDPIFLLCV